MGGGIRAWAGGRLCVGPPEGRTTGFERRCRGDCVQSAPRSRQGDRLLIRRRAMARGSPWTWRDCRGDFSRCFSSICSAGDRRGSVTVRGGTREKGASDDRPGVPPVPVVRYPAVRRRAGRLQALGCLRVPQPGAEGKRGCGGILWTKFPSRVRMSVENRISDGVSPSLGAPQGSTRDERLGSGGIRGVCP